MPTNTQYGEETTVEGGLAKGARGDPREGIMVSLPAFVETWQSRIMENDKAKTPSNAVCWLEPMQNHQRGGLGPRCREVPMISKAMPPGRE
jgi:hypothetical protein